MTRGTGPIPECRKEKAESKEPGLEKDVGFIPSMTCCRRVRKQRVDTCQSVLERDTRKGPKEAAKDNGEMAGAHNGARYHKTIGQMI